jgi:hypothetical protein
MGLESSNGFERNKATLLGWPFWACRGFSRDSLRILPSREAVFAAFKKNPKQQLLAFSYQPLARFAAVRCIDSARCKLAAKS